MRYYYKYIGEDGEVWSLLDTTNPVNREKHPQWIQITEEEYIELDK